MKKILHKLFGFGILGLLGLSYFMPIGNQVNAQLGTQDTTYNPGVPGSGALAEDGLITSIKIFINRVLGILALITLIILLRGGFQMVTAAGDEGKYKEGFKILKQAAFGLGFIGLSRLMVSLIFWIITKVAGA